jgi:hypothetical protein
MVDAAVHEAFCLLETDLNLTGIILKPTPQGIKREMGPLATNNLARWTLRERGSAPQTSHHEMMQLTKIDGAATDAKACLDRVLLFSFSHHVRSRQLDDIRQSMHAEYVVKTQASPMVYSSNGETPDQSYSLQLWRSPVMEGRGTKWPAAALAIING